MKHISAENFPTSHIVHGAVRTLNARPNLRLEISFVQWLHLQEEARALVTLQGNK